MSIHSIKEYQNEVEKVIHYGGTSKEMAIRTAFYNLLNTYAKQKGFLLVPEVTIMGENGKNVTPDGTLKDSLRQDWGYWESKDEADNIDEEIDKKFKKGYPKDNILFEDSKTCVLIQNGQEVMRVATSDANAVDKILNAFIGYERPEVKHFRDAIEHFKEDVPRVTEVLRKIIDKQEEGNAEFLEARYKFLELCKESINPDIVKDDVREMMIQHVLTEDIFNVIFDETQFHRENNIGKELEKVINTFFTGSVRRSALERIQHYYKVINSTAASIPDHHEKQKFLKVVYETFYKSYNPKAADRLGVVYTPNEIVKFMIESTDYLLHKHFGRFLEDENVDILDPATGTGTFICDIIDYLGKDKVEYKYKNELHANEVAILPYYIANLNIEYTYKQKTGKYAEFQKLCFVDTLDNMGFEYADKQYTMFGVSSENTERIKRQNEKKISVVIGNPPYNANQKNENENNKNREYPIIDKRIKDTYIRESTAQKTKLYDMYTRFIRWASDRLEKNGILAFVSNSSFIDSRTYDGFRKYIEKEFNEVYIIDLKGNARTSGERRRKEGGNVFSDKIRVGIAVYFFVRKEGSKRCNIYYNAIKDYAKDYEKQTYLAENKLKEISFEHKHPDKNHNWINIADNDFDELLTLANKETKLGKSENSLFKLYSLGTVSNRDEWVYDFSEKYLSKKIRYFIEIYNSDLEKLKGKLNENNVNDLINNTIKYTRDVKKDLIKNKRYEYSKTELRECLYRVFTKKKLYFAAELNEMRYQMPSIYPNINSINNLIAINQSNKDFNVLASKYLVDLHYNGDSQCFPLYRYDEDGNRLDNITDWGLEQFKSNYKSKKITKEDIFYYVYAVLHNPVYRKKYELNLKRDLPRIPFYGDFNKWRSWGKSLLDLHINYETVKPFTLNVASEQRSDTGKGKKDLFDNKYDNKIKAKLKADKINGWIELDEVTTISGIPKEAWEYKLGNRSALEWILDQHKEKKPSDPTIAEKFNTYRFADYKDQVIDLLKRVTTVSVETMKIIGEMEKEKPL